MSKNFLYLIITILFIIIFLKSDGQSWSLTGNSNTSPNTNFIGTINNKALIFRSHNVERMRINSNGKIGIGTTSPQALLSITNSGMNSLSDPGSLIIGNQTATNLGFDYQEIQARYDGQGATLFLNHLGGAVSVGSYNGTVFPALWTNADGRVGIGTNYAIATGYALTVDPIHLGNGIAINDPGNGYSLYTVKTGNTGAAIHVEATSTYTAAIEVFTKNAQRASYGEDYLNGNGVEGRSYGGNGVVGFSTVNVGVLGIAPAYAGYFDGDVYASGTYVGSDQKLKQNINDFPGAMDIIDQLHPKHYEYRHDGNYKLMNLPGGTHYGLIAQDVEKLLPGLVKDTKFDTRYAKPDTTGKRSPEVIDFKALNYTELIPIIIKGMQELHTVSDQQEQQIQQQQKQIDDLQKMTNALLNDKIAITNFNNAYLLQNSPNPFSQNSIIRYYVPSSVKQAQLTVYSIDGKLLKSYALNKNMNETMISAGTFPPGEYLYALLIDGRKIDNKNMIVAK